MEAPPVQYVTTRDGYSIAFTVGGEGDPVILLPLPFNNVGRYSETLLGRWADQLTPRRRIVLYDSRGQGMSTRGLPPTHNVDDYEVDLDAVARRNTHGRFGLVAGRYFGHVAIRYAVAHLSEVSFLVLWNCSLTGGEPLSQLYRGTLEDWHYMLDHMARASFGIRQDPVSARSFYESSVTQADFSARLEAFRDSSIEAPAKLLDIPTLILSTSAMRREEDAAKRLGGLMTRSRVVLFDDISAGMLPDSSGVPPAVPVIEAFISEVDSGEKTADESPVARSDLSSRELEVLRLIAAGKSNAQIAEALVISQNTVIRHVSNIFAKVGVANRAEATSYAHRNGIV